LSTTEAGCEPAEGTQSARNIEPKLKHRARDAIVALSLANVCLVSAWFPLLYDQDKGYYNKALITRPELLALGTNILTMSLVAWLVMRLPRAFQKLPRIISDLLLIALPSFHFDFAAAYLRHSRLHRSAFFLRSIVGQSRHCFLGC
jgi:hypothetical protein